LDDAMLSVINLADAEYHANYHGPILNQTPHTHLCPTLRDVSQILPQI
jgi:hypothetical protein